MLNLYEDKRGGMQCSDTVVTWYSVHVLCTGQETLHLSDLLGTFNLVKQYSTQFTNSDPS